MAGIRIRNREDFERWLNGIADKKQRRRVAIALANRAAMRVLPVQEQWLAEEEKKATTIILSTFRAIITSQLAAMMVSSDVEVKDAAARAYANARADATFATSYAATVRANAAFSAFSAFSAAFSTFSAFSTTFSAFSAAHTDTTFTTARTVAVHANAALTSIADATAWKALETDIHFLLENNDVAKLLNTPLWPQGTPDWAAKLWQSMKSRLLAREGEHWEVWTNWYDARLDPSRRIPCYSSPDMELERQRVLLPEDLWEQGPATVNAAIKELIANHECSEAEPPPPPPPPREEETTDTTQETAIPDDLDDPEPQNDDALTFTFSGEGPIDVDERNGVDQLRHDAEARELHSETRRKAQALLGLSARNETGDNATSQLIEEAELFTDALGETTQEVKPALLVVRGDTLRNMLAAQQERDDFSDIPPLPERYLLALRNLVSAYNVYVAIDPELFRRDAARLGPDAARNMIAPDDGMRVIEDAVKENLATDKVKQVMAEEAVNAPETPTPENRISRRFTESVRNFARAALAKLWFNKGKITVGGAGTAIGLYHLANWVLRNEQWFLAVFKHNPSMHAWVMQFINWLKTLPLA